MSAPPNTKSVNRTVSRASRNSCLALALLATMLLAGCDQPRPEFLVTVENGTDQPVDVWVRIETLRGDMKHNGPLTAAANGEDHLSMGYFQGTYRFTALLDGQARQDIESVLPKDDWVVAVQADGGLCFRFGRSGEGEERCD